MLTPAFFKTNRSRFAQTLSPGELALFYSGREIQASLDENYPFQVDNNYYYLTGLTEPEGTLAVYKNADGSTGETLFIPPADALQEKWTGRKLRPDEAARRSGVEDIRTDSPEHFLEDFRLGLDGLQAEHQKPPYTADFDTSETLQKLRVVKQPEEIAAIKEAAALTAEGLEAVFSDMNPGQHEYEHAALFEYTIKKNGADGVSFGTIAASGPNGPVLHYVENSRKTEPGDLILFDLGARKDGYAADVSRTVPVSGHFSALQEKFYRAVLDSQRELIKNYTAGMRLRDLQALAKRCFIKNLEKYGVPLPEGGIDAWYYHGIGHSLGLDTHDGTNRDLVLEDGMVITCEPGLYAEEYGIGIRIEDDILINGDSPVNLTAEIAKEPEEICRLIVDR